MTETESQPYRIETITTGILEEQEIRSISMSRARFLEIVEETLEGGNYSQDIRDELTPVARTMVRFPLNSWIHPVRGCGCVIGEYLVATSELSRLDLSGELDGPMIKQIKTVDQLLSANPKGSLLRRFGGDIDEAIKNDLCLTGIVSYDVIYDDLEGDEITVYVDSVEIID